MKLLMRELFVRDLLVMFNTVFVNLLEGKVVSMIAMQPSIYKGIGLGRDS